MIFRLKNQAVILLILLSAFVVTTIGYTDTYLLITVDVKALKPGDPSMQRIWGEINGNHYGIERIMDICEKHNVKATFFVDVYEYDKFGKDAMRNVCLTIINRGHDVQLHTHPWFEYGRPWRPISSYSLEQQKVIIKERKELLFDWIREYPVAHRAGGYGANYDTLQALAANDIKIDSSNFYLYDKCDIKPPITRNAIVIHEGIIELPVTVFARYNMLTFLKMPIRKSILGYPKIDIDWQDLNILKDSITKLCDKDVRTITLFMHSYSFIKSNSTNIDIEPDKQDILEFDELLGFLTQTQEVKIITVKELYSLYEKGKFNISSSDFVPEYEVSREDVFIHALLHFGHSWESTIIILAILLIVVSSIWGVIILKKRQSTM